MKSIKSIGIACVSIAVLAAAWHLWSERQGIHNIVECESIRPGATVQDLTAAFGEPTHEWSAQSESWMAFETPSIRAGSIKAQVKEHTGEVLVLFCSEDGPAHWNIGE